MLLDFCLYKLWLSLPQGPQEDAEAESPLSVKELQELVRKKQEEKVNKELQKKEEQEKKILQLKKEEEERGISWGMGEPALAW